MTTKTYTAKTAVQAAIGNLPEKLDMIYIGQGDHLTDEQVGFLLAGDIDKVWESFEHWEADHRWESAKQFLSEATIDDPRAYYGPPQEGDWFDAVYDTDGWEEFREACDERDVSDPLKDLMHATPSPMIRYSLGHEVTPNSWSMDDDEVRAEMEGIAEALGIILHDSRNFLKLHSLVAEAGYGGTLTILHRTDLEDAIKVRDGGTVVFTDPQVLVYDGWNGSGSMEQITGTVTVKVDEDTMQHDVGSYSWSDDIAGIVHSCADTPATFIPKEKQTA